jgi:endoglucanase
MLQIKREKKRSEYMSKEMKKTLEKFSNAEGPSGHESNISELFKTELKGFADSFEYDNLGSIAAIKKGTGKGPKVMIAAHIDEIGFVVTKITKQGYIKITALGG